MGTILHPRIESLIKLVEASRSELVALISEKEQLACKELPALKTQYDAFIGKYQHKLLQLQIETLRIRRMLELIIQAENQQKKPDIKAINQQLEKELKEWNQKIADLSAEINSAQKKLANLLTNEESNRIKKSYRELVKKLHPDLGMIQTPEIVQLWHRAQHYYKYGDYEGLENLLIIAESLTAQLPVFDREEELQNELKRVVQKSKKLNEDITEIKNRPDYKLYSIVLDEKLTNEEIIKIETQIESLTAQKIVYEARLKGYLK